MEEEEEEEEEGVLGGVLGAAAAAAEDGRDCCMGMGLVLVVGDEARGPAVCSV